MSEFRYYRPDAFPPVVKNLLIINVLVFLAQVTFQNSETVHLENLFALHDVRSVYFKPHQLLTHLFMHGSMGHIFFNMFALWMFGQTLENRFGSKRFLIFYLVAGLGAALLHLAVLYFELQPVWELFRSLPADQQAEIVRSPEFKINVETVGASGAIFGCLAAFGYLFPNTMIYVYFLLPLKAKWFVLIYAGLELWLGIRNSAGDNVAHFAHLGGALAGFLLVLFWNKTDRRRFY
ncbi:rhomboid family intramembrane serine protease [Flavisolibacter nicotianae]|uniref:rhomboid family intramembrane serine protease n=1 Tax=Flavisolibacter nicotianae TaxID=2364882 RepID=UPI000EAE8727|nr:rhomboid family intramembrane serine protease [Flavisolibacter nicotianae]